MSTVPQLLFSVRPEYYAALTIESVVADNGGNVGTLLEPPIRQPFSESGMLRPEDPSILNQIVFSRPWNRWFQDVWRWITGGTSGSTIQFLAPSVDETDAEWYGTGTINATDDPVTISIEVAGKSRFGIQAVLSAGGSGYTAATFTISSQDGKGRPATGTATVSGGKVQALPVSYQGYGLTVPLVVAITGDGTGAAGIALPGRQWGIGDLIVWNDPTIASPLSDNRYQYEIDLISDIEPIDDTHFLLTLARRSKGAAGGYAQYGSRKDAHTNIQFYRMINDAFYRQINADNGPQVFVEPWANMTVTAVQASSPGIPSVLFNLAPRPYLPGTTTPDPRNTPPEPGLRTMNGAAYTSLGITGVLSVGQTSAAKISAQAWESVRTLYAKIQTQATGPVAFMGNVSACVVIYVCYIAPDGTVGLLDTVVINEMKNTSYASTNVPDGRQMPYHVYFPTTGATRDWPPNRLPVNTTGLTAGGALQLPIVIDPTQTVVFHPDGQIDFIISQVGSGTPGSDLIVTVQT